LLGNPPEVRLRRRSTDNLSVAERRVLEAFYCGHLPAGRLSEALAAARRRPAVQSKQPATAEPAVPLQLAA
jgi:hypothetical protein